MPVAFITARRTRLALATCPLARKAPLLFAVQRPASALPFLCPPPSQAASQGQALCVATACAPRAPGAELQPLLHHSISGAPGALLPSACLRVQLSSNVRPAEEQCWLSSSRLAARGSPLPLVPSVVRHLWSWPFSAPLRPSRSVARHHRQLLRRGRSIARRLVALPAHRAQNFNFSSSTPSRVRPVRCASAAGLTGRSS
jgi:hypothetical protein